MAAEKNHDSGLLSLASNARVVQIGNPADLSLMLPIILVDNTIITLR